MGIWPVGYCRAITSWLLRNRKEVAARIDTITAEIARIGFVKVKYQTKTDPVTGAQEPTEVRIAVSVTPGSSLGMLMRAYIANGGNPLDISPFSHPDGTTVSVGPGDEAVSSFAYPHGGVVAPLSAEPMENVEVMVDGPDGNPVDSGFGQDRGGWLNTDRYYPARQGGRADRGSWDSDSIVKAIHHTRQWANQEIKERLQDLEWRIIKLCDLREQLIRERDEILVQAFGGVLRGVKSFDQGRFNPDLLVQNVVNLLYYQIYETDGKGLVSTKASKKIGLLPFTFEDLPSELRDPMGC
jgi:hypothetical protein